VLTANIIAENILTQVDKDGHTLILINNILDHCTNNDLISGDDAYCTNNHGNKQVKRKTKGWEMMIIAPTLTVTNKLSAQPKVGKFVFFEKMVLQIGSL
jgi:hypothetical protein